MELQERFLRMLMESRLCCCGSDNLTWGPTARQFSWKTRCSNDLQTFMCKIGGVCCIYYGEIDARYYNIQTAFHSFASHQVEWNLKFTNIVAFDVNWFCKTMKLKQMMDCFKFEVKHRSNPVWPFPAGRDITGQFLSLPLTCAVLRWAPPAPSHRCSSSCNSIHSAQLLSGRGDFSASAQIKLRAKPH